MYRKSKKLLVWALVVCMLITNMLFTNLAFAATTLSSSTSRFAGADRYQTAIAISQDWAAGSTQYAVLAYGEGFADALAAAPLAEKYNAPILLTDKDALSAGVLAELQRIGVKNVFIVGGEGVVSKAVADALTAASITPERLAGADRYATALAVANKMGTTTEVVVANGENYPDALGIAAIAAYKGMPILLTDKDAMNADVKAYIGTKKAYVVGGESVVGAAVFNGLTSAVRLAGADRYATNLAVLQQFAADLNWANVFVATGEGFADALAGSALAAKYGSPVVLAGASLDAATASFLGGKVTSSTGVFAFGGAAVVGDAVVASVKPVVVTPGTLGVDSITSLGLNGVKVVFNQEVDKDSAINVENYTLDGVKLVKGTDKAQLQSDNKTLYIIKNTPFTQYTNTLFTIKDKSIYTKDLLSMIPKTEKSLSFSDAAEPQVQSVSVTGNKKLTVLFNEPVLVNATVASDGSTTNLTNASVKFKVDDQYISSYGFKAATFTTATAGTAANTYNDKYAIKLDITFDVAIPAGTHTLTTLKGSADCFNSAANFRVPETNTQFTIDTVTGAPQVVSVTGETNGVVYVTYDRSMDDNAKTAANYAMNANIGGNTPSVAIDFVSGTSSKQVKMTFPTSLINTGANVLTIDNGVKDAWGNKLHDTDDQRFSFSCVKDTTKPVVNSVVVTSATNIRVKFSEPVDITYAQKTGNYELKDSAGVPISITSSVKNGGSALSADTYDLTIAENVTGSNYTLTVKNIIDMANNQMDTYVATINGNDTVSPEVTQVVMVAGSTSKVAVYFTEAMDPATLTDPANYAYLDTKTTSETHSLPSSASVTAGDGNKSVLISFPSGYVVTTNTSTQSDYYVLQIRTSNVKDVAGNLLKDISQIKPVVDSSLATAGQPKFTTETFYLFYDSSTAVRAEFNTNQVLSRFEKSDFAIDGFGGSYGAGIKPTNGYVSGNKVVLYFEGAGYRDKVAGFGTTATLFTGTIQSANADGIKMAAITDPAKVYDDQIAPEWTGVTTITALQATNTVGYVGETLASATTVMLTFSEKIDPSVYGDYKDDFVFTSGGVQLSVNAWGVADNHVYYQFTTALSAPVTVVAKPAKISIRDCKDRGPGDYNTLRLFTGDDTDGHQSTWTR